MFRTCPWTCECLFCLQLKLRLAVSQATACDGNVALRIHDVDLLCFLVISFALQLRRYAAGLYDAQHAFDAVTRSLLESLRQKSICCCRPVPELLQAG